MDVADIVDRIARALVEKGATHIDQKTCRITFRAERAPYYSMTNPLGSCRRGRLRVDATPKEFRIRYELDRIYAIYWLVPALAFGSVFGLIELSGGSKFSLLLALTWVVLPLSFLLGYALDARAARSLFESAARDA